MSLIEDHAEQAGIPVRFAASKLAEGDSLVLERLGLDQNEKETLEHIICQMEKERGLDRAAAIADMRFSFIQKVCASSVVKPRESREHARSVRMDRILTGKYTAIPAFIAIMALVFWLTFNVIGAFLADLLDMGIGWLTDLVDAAMTAGHVNPVLHSLVIDGIFNGVGSVLSFLPIIVTLVFFLSMLEDSGYMARVAFVMDKLLRKIGLSGRSVVPMLIGFGCTVPGVMASRTLPSERDRKMTILLTPYMSCSAKLPIYAFFAEAFFPRNGALVMIGLYFIGILVGILMALLLRGTAFRGEAVPFVMELPNYRMPGAKKCRPAALGQGEGLPAARVYGHLYRDNRDLVPADVRHAAQYRHRFAGQHPRHGRRLDRPDLCAARLRRLAHLHRADHRLHGQGKRRFHAVGALRLHGGAHLHAHAAFCDELARVLPAVYAVRRGDRVRPA